VSLIELVFLGFKESKKKKVNKKTKPTSLLPLLNQQKIIMLVNIPLDSSYTTPSSTVYTTRSSCDFTFSNEFPIGHITPSIFFH
jgi:hypothetical protein